MMRLTESTRKNKMPANARLWRLLESHAPDRLTTLNYPTHFRFEDVVTTLCLSNPSVNYY
jgi:hypothetical protein